MIDAGSTGPKFTWNNKRTGGANIQERLDTVLINSLWRSKFHNAQVKHLSYFNFDHRAIMLDLNPFTPLKHRPFRGEAIWTEDFRFTNVVRKVGKTIIADPPLLHLFLILTTFIRMLKFGTRPLLAILGIR